MADSPKTPKMINMGTKENPVLVPADVANGTNSPTSERWWQGIVIGSIVINNNILDRLLKIKW